MGVAQTKRRPGIHPSFVYRDIEGQSLPGLGTWGIRRQLEDPAGPPQSDEAPPGQEPDLGDGGAGVDADQPQGAGQPEAVRKGGGKEEGRGRTQHQSPEAFPPGPGHLHARQPKAIGAEDLHTATLSQRGSGG